VKAENGVTEESKETVDLTLVLNEFTGDSNTLIIAIVVTFAVLIVLAVGIIAVFILYFQ